MQYFRPSLSYHLSVRSLFSLFLSGRSIQGLLYLTSSYISHWVFRKSKKLLTIDERGSQIARNSVFDCHLSLCGRQMAIENYVSNDF